MTTYVEKDRNEKPAGKTIMKRNFSKHLTTSKAVIKHRLAMFEKIRKCLERY